MAELTIIHDYTDGTRLEGSDKGDGVYEIMQAAYGWQWRRLSGIHIPQSRDKDAQMHKVNPFKKALEDAGHTVTLDIDNTPNTAADREQARADRAANRADRLEDAAGKAAARSDAAHTAAQDIGDQIPMGQPVLTDHYSAPRHRRALDRMNSNMRKSCDEADKAESLAQRAAGSRSNEAHKHTPAAIMRRIETLQTEARKLQRNLDGYVRNFRNNAGEIYQTEEHKPAAEGSPYRERAERRIAVIAEEVTHLQSKLPRVWGPDDFVKGDSVNVGGDWYPVRRVNKKSVSVPWRVGSHGGNWSEHSDTIPWDKVCGRRRDGLQLDTPAGEAWPVEQARKVARWDQLVTCLRRSPHDDDSRTEQRRVRWAMRIVHGLDLDAGTAEVDAYALPEDAPVEERRARAVAYLAVFDRLTAGEKPSDIAATTTPTGEAAWTLPPEDTAEDVRADLVVPGDLVRGVYDRSFSGDRLIRSMCGPVQHVSPVRDRRESGEWVTITLEDGSEHEMKTHRWLSVHRTPAAAELDKPAALGSPERLEQLTSPLVGRDVIAHVPAAGGDVPIHVTGNAGGVLTGTGANGEPLTIDIMDTTGTRYADPAPSTAVNRECRKARKRPIPFDCKLGAGHEGKCSPFTLPPAATYGKGAAFEGSTPQTFDTWAEAAAANGVTG